MSTTSIGKTLLAAGISALLWPAAAQAGAAPYGDTYRPKPGGHFDYLSRCNDAHLPPADRLTYCRQVIDNGRGIRADDEVLLTMAGLYREERDYPTALSTLDKILARETGNGTEGVDAELLAEIYEERGVVHLALKRYDDSFADMTRAMSFMPNDARFLAARCRARVVSDRDLKAAVADCDEAVKLKPDMSGAWETKIVADYKLSDYTATVADCEGELKLDPKSALALYIRGLVKRQAGDTAAGNADIVEALHENPNIAALLAIAGLAP